MSISSQGSSGSSHGGSRSGSGRPKTIKRPGAPGRGHKSNLKFIKKTKVLNKLIYLLSNLT
jgi:hypothetical protein